MLEKKCQSWFFFEKIAFYCLKWPKKWPTWVKILMRVYIALKWPVLHFLFSSTFTQMALNGTCVGLHWIQEVSVYRLCTTEVLAHLLKPGLACLTIVWLFRRRISYPFLETKQVLKMLILPKIECLLY